MATIFALSKSCESYLNYPGFHGSPPSPSGIHHYPSHFKKYDAWIRTLFYVVLRSMCCIFLMCCLRFQWLLKLCPTGPEGQNCGVYGGDERVGVMSRPTQYEKQCIPTEFQETLERSCKFKRASSWSTRRTEPKSYQTRRMNLRIPYHPMLEVLDYAGLQNEKD